jgi:endonuclease/exonuclease/phosphatase family metal-dependent hydrolase
LIDSRRKIKIGNRNVKVINAHLKAFDEGSRIIQAKEVRDLYEKYAFEIPVILLGDFNSAPFFEMSENRAMEVIMKAKDIKLVISKTMYESDPK